MANRRKVVSQIRFQLDQLSVKNAHHEFEHLCRHLARARICSNILPATGPVSAGGDQGKDFETFRTYLRSTPIANSIFIGLVSPRPIAFGCSLQRKDILGKIKSDVKTIMKTGPAVEAIHYFASSDIGISARNKLKCWVRENYSIELEIYDGQSISELLADPEVFWIAEEYLSIPSEIYPKTRDEDNRYSESLKSWKQRKISTINYADFYEIKAMVRHATFSTKHKQDVRFWIKLMENFITDDTFPHLKRKAIYEVAVVSLRGLGTLLGQEARLREYFDAIPELLDPVDIEDAAVLLTYCSGAYYRNNVRLTGNELLAWFKKLIVRIEEELKTAKTSNLKCALLKTRGYISLLTFREPQGPPGPPDIDGAITSWKEVIVNAKDALLFPLERFADLLIGFVDLIGDHPEYNHLTQQVDLLLSKRYGNFIAAEKCRDRAVQFHKNRQILKAMNQLHQAKVKWFAEETLRGSLLCMLLISQWYLEVGLSFAAKYYALAAAFIALRSSKSDVKTLSPRALIAAAECDYYQGAWCGFLDLTGIGLKTHALFGKEKTDPMTLDEFDETLFHTSMLMAITERLDLQLFEFVARRIQEWNIEDWLEELLPMARKSVGDQDTSDIWTRMEEELGGRPFGDLGDIRQVTWSEFGIVWRVKWKNNYETTALAEEFIAVLQVLLADLADVDLCLLKTEVDIELCWGNVDNAKAEPIPSNLGRKWKVTLPTGSVSDKESAIERSHVNILSAATSILAEVSLVPSERFHQILENSFRNGISMKVFVGRPYETLYREFVSKKVFVSSNRSAKSIPDLHRQFKIKEHKELAWFDGLGPGYSKKRAKEYLKNRYTRLEIPIRYTLKRLLESSQFRSTVKQLRGEGWLDWHILSAVASANINYRVMQVPDARRDIHIQQRLFLRIMNDPEPKSAPPIPLEQFTVGKLRTFLDMTMLSTLKVIGLECRQQTPDFRAINHFLQHRYNYWTDDIQHPDLFG